MKNEDLYVYKKSDFSEDFISSQKEYYDREQVDTLLSEKDKEIALLKERICNGDVSRLTWIDDCIAKDKEIAELKKENLNLKAKNIELQSFYDLHGNVDNYIDKLKAENKLLKEHIANGDVSRITWIDEVIELKQKLESVQASMYCDVVDANMENRKLKHALWNLRACYADMMQKRYIECKYDGWVHRVDKWIEVERKCLKKAEEYK